MLMDNALHGTVKEPPVVAEIAENPEATNQVAGVVAIGSSNVYSMLKVGVPEVTAAPMPTLKFA
jgi:hypothetical protein